MKETGEGTVSQLQGNELVAVTSNLSRKTASSLPLYSKEEGATINYVPTRP